jgi:hypothetical protein
MQQKMQNKVQIFAGEPELLPAPIAALVPDGGVVPRLFAVPPRAAAPVQTALAVPQSLRGALRNSALALHIKKHLAYTEAMGQDLGIIGAEQTIEHTSLKSVLQITLQSGRPIIIWRKQGMDSLELWVDRGDGKGFVFLAIDSVPGYTDTATLRGGTSAGWKPKGSYRESDEQAGQWSDVVSTPVMG